LERVIIKKIARDTAITSVGKTDRITTRDLIPHSLFTTNSLVMLRLINSLAKKLHFDEYSQDTSARTMALVGAGKPSTVNLGSFSSKNC